MPIIVCAPTARTLPKLERFVKEYDIKIAIHNHGRTDKHFPTPQSALKFVNNMDPRCGLCLDVGHTAETGVDVVDSIRQAGSRLLDVHIKDTSDLADASKTPVGEGKMPVAAIFRQLTQMNYRGRDARYEVDENDPLPGMAKVSPICAAFSQGCVRRKGSRSPCGSPCFRARARAHLQHHIRVKRTDHALLDRRDHMLINMEDSLGEDSLG
jgi:hypothetical protein